MTQTLNPLDALAPRRTRPAEPVEQVEQAGANPLDALAPREQTGAAPKERPEDTGAFIPSPGEFVRRAVRQIFSPIEPVQKGAQSLSDVIDPAGGQRRQLQEEQLRAAGIDPDAPFELPSSLPEAAEMLGGVAKSFVSNIVQLPGALVGAIRAYSEEPQATQRGFIASLVETAGGATPLDALFLKSIPKTAKVARTRPARSIDDILEQTTEAPKPKRTRTEVRVERENLDGARLSQEALVNSAREAEQIVARAAADNVERVARRLGFTEAEVKRLTVEKGADYVGRQQKVAEALTPPRAPRTPPPAEVSAAAAAEAIADNPITPRLAPMPKLPGAPKKRVSAQKARKSTRSEPAPSARAVPPVPRVKDVAKSGAPKAYLSTVRADSFGVGVGAQVNTAQGPGVVRRVFNIDGQEILEVSPPAKGWRDPQPKQPRLGLTDADRNRSSFGMLGDFTPTTRSHGPSSYTTSTAGLPPEMVQRVRKSARRIRGEDAGFGTTAALPIAAGAGVGGAAGAATGDSPEESLIRGLAGALAGGAAGSQLPRLVRGVRTPSATGPDPLLADPFGINPGPTSRREFLARTGSLRRAERTIDRLARDDPGDVNWIERINAETRQALSRFPEEIEDLNPQDIPQNISFRQALEAAVREGAGQGAREGRLSGAIQTAMGRRREVSAANKVARSTDGPTDIARNLGPPPRGIDPDAWTQINAIEREANRLINEQGITDVRLVREMRNFWGSQEAARRLGLTGREGARVVKELTGEPSRRPLRAIAEETDRRYRHLINDPDGFMRVEAVLAGAGAAAGGLAGLTIEGEDAMDRVANAVSGMLIGGAAGLVTGVGARAAGRGAQRTVNRARRALDTGKMPETPQSLRTLEAMDTANLLLGPASIKASFGALSGYAAGAYQRLREAKAARAAGNTAEAARLMTQYRSMMRYMRREGPSNWFRVLTAPTDELLKAASPKMKEVTDQVRNTLPDRVMVNVLRPFLAGDQSAIVGLRRGGFSISEARRLMLAGEPTSWPGQVILTTINSSFAGRMLVKFPRVRVMGLERAAEFTPGVSRIMAGRTRVTASTKLSPNPVIRGAQVQARKTAEPLSEAGRKARARFGGAMFLAGTAYGALEDPGVRRAGVVSAAAGPAFVPAAAGIAAGKALRRGKNPLAEILAQVASEVPQLGEGDIRRLPGRIVPFGAIRRALSEDPTAPRR